MTNKVIPFPAEITSESQTVMVRHRMYVAVNSLRYEIDIIGILTPLAPTPASQTEPPVDAGAERKKPRRTLVSPACVPPPTKQVASASRTKLNRTKIAPELPSHSRKRGGERRELVGAVIVLIALLFG
jgi:hypothetical protein